MRTSLLTVASLALALAATPLFAQQSPAATARATIAGKTVSIQYSAPSVRGRQIFGPGGLLSKDPTYPVWRAGANAATTLRTDADLMIGSVAVPKGTYTLYAVVRDPNAWELVISRNTGQWGLEYDATRDLARIKMTMSKPPALVEALKYTLSDKGNGNGELRLEWEQHIATLAFTAK